MSVASIFSRSRNRVKQETGKQKLIFSCHDAFYDSAGQNLHNSYVKPGYFTIRLVLCFLVFLHNGSDIHLFKLQSMHLF